ncbi:hypothetical protein NQ315_012030 [Exocentrus adspersus]|uniref:Uncharacterized protein n=1 Tax=Exocentrus adspersus TaxID=1586481 RepID=A0AAV8VIS0_9CUCU|nr:hypothetical protein NQ315_012030 [Exocentrus adspersus]
MSFDEELMDCTPPEMRQAADAAAHGLWCEEKKVKNTSSESVLLAYFEEQTREKKPSTFWALYNMIRTMLQIEK